MRPLASFTLHAVLAAAIAAIAATSAAAGPAFLKLGGVEGVSGAPKSGRGEQIEIQSFQWGTANAAPGLGIWSKVDGLKVNEDAAESGQAQKDMVLKGQNSRPRGGGANQISMDDTAGTETASTGGVSVASGDVNGDGRAAPGLPTGKRQHKPFTTTKPLDKGSVWIRVSSPWAACRIGARYPSITLVDDAKQFVLHDVSVASCGQTAVGQPTEEVAFYYNRIAFNY